MLESGAEDADGGGEGEDDRDVEIFPAHEDEAECGKEDGERIDASRGGADEVECEPDGEVQHDADDGGGDGGEGCGEAVVLAGAFHPWCAGEDEEEAGKESHPCGECGGGGGDEPWGEVAGVVPCGEEAYELED